MRIDTLAGNTVKITLEPSDMDGCNIKYEDISGRSHETELALSRLISTVCEKHGLKLSGERLLVEAFPKCDGGCTLYVSCLKGARQKPPKPSCEDNRIVICSGRLSDIAALCRILRKKREKASLYHDAKTDSYRLVIYACKNGTKHIAAEYTEIIGSGKAALCDTEEYFRLITPTAPEIISDCF